VAALLTSAAAAVPAGSKAQSDAKNPDSSWKIKIVKAAKTAAPSAATPAKEPAAATPTKEPAAAKEAAAAAKGSIVPWYRPVTFAAVPRWEHDDHLAAFKTFLASCDRVIARGRDATAENDAKRPRVPPAALVAACVEAKEAARQVTSREAARAFFEANFTPHAVVVKKGPAGMLTGYYEPVLEGSRTPEGRFQTPIYKRPPDLINVVHDTQRGTLKPGALTHVRKTATGTEPYYTRAEIEGGALKGKELELLYLADRVDIFFMQIQGSGRIRLPDGSTVRVHYDGKNGHPYNSIGRYLIDKAIVAADRMSMQALMAWLRADPERGRQVMWQNTSYVFFRELKDDQGSPLGALQVPLTPGRSLAIDPSFHALGIPIYISVPSMRHGGVPTPFHRLMVGQDVGSAIRGPERGDIYFGSGDEAAKLAGNTKNPGRFFVLVPKVPAAATVAGPVGSPPASTGAQKAQE
jgi:membrane-bound lytic murein transglycosylase A